MSKRVNIEGSLWSDPRFVKLSEKIGRRLAIAVVVEAWVLAQEYWGRGQQLIPASLWEISDFPDALIEVGLVEKKPEGYYARGARERFQWLQDCRKNGQKGGKASAAARTKKNSNLDEANPTFCSVLFSSDLKSREEAPPAETRKTEMHWLAQAWNERVVPPLARVKLVTPDRLALIKSRLKQNPDRAFWLEVLEKIRQSDFLTGRKPSQTNPNWKADFDWLVRKDMTSARIYEGQYDNSAARGQQLFEVEK